MDHSRKLSRAPCTLIPFLAMIGSVPIPSRVITDAVRRSCVANETPAVTAPMIGIVWRMNRGTVCSLAIASVNLVLHVIGI